MKLAMKKIFFLLIFLLNSCGDMGCIAKNDYGFGSISISANQKNAETIKQDSNVEKATSVNTGYFLNIKDGILLQDLIVRIKGAWSPWAKEDLESGACGYRNYVCTIPSYYEENNKITSDTDFEFPEATLLNKIKLNSNAQAGGYEFKNKCDDNVAQRKVCWFPYGLGVYLSFKKLGTQNNLEYVYHLTYNEDSNIATFSIDYESGEGVFILKKEYVNANLLTNLGIFSGNEVAISVLVHDNDFSNNSSNCILDASKKAIALEALKEAAILESERIVSKILELQKELEDFKKKKEAELTLEDKERLIELERLMTLREVSNLTQEQEKELINLNADNQLTVLKRFTEEQENKLQGLADLETQRIANRYPRGCLLNDENCIEDIDHICDERMSLRFDQGIKIKGAGVFSKMVQYIETIFEGFIRKFYQAYTGSKSYQFIYYLLLVISVIFYGLAFFMGVVDIDRKTLLKMAIKFAIIASLLNPDAGWAFFQKYVYNFFIFIRDSVINQMLDLVISQPNTSLGGFIEINSFSANSFVSFARNIDYFFDAIISKQINAKIWGILFESVLGWFIIIITYLFLAVFLISLFKMIFLLIYIIILTNMLFALAPIFFISLIFEHTKEYFDKWLQMLIGITIQPIIIIPFMVFLLSLVTSFLAELFSYEVCWDYLGNDAFFVALNLKFWIVQAASDEVSIRFSTILTAIIGIFIIIYVTDEVPKISDAISGGISVAGVAGTINNSINTVSKYAGKVGLALPTVAAKRSARFVGRKMNLEIADGSDANALQDARRELNKRLLSKGFSSSEIKEKLKDSPEMRQMYAKHLALRDARDKKYYKNTKNPLEMIWGGLKEEFDKQKIGFNTKGLSDKKKRTRINASLGVEEEKLEQKHKEQAKKYFENQEKKKK